MLSPGGARVVAPPRTRVVDHFLFDLDGTISRQEILPEIARAIGIEPEMAALTRRTMQGTVPFESSLRRRVELLREVPVSQVRTIVAAIELDPVICEFIAEHRDRCTIVTGNLDVWIGELVDRLGVPVRCSTATVRDDRITALTHVLDKAEVVADFRGTLCHVGDGANDVGLMEAADFGVAYGGVHPPADALLAVATHATYDPRTLCRLLRGLS